MHTKTSKFQNKSSLILVFQLIITCFCLPLFAQELPNNWHNLDPINDQYMGTSTNKALNSLLKNKKPETVIVAVIDGGVEVDHPDLEGVIWTNSKEIPNNGIDDDQNGYVDDIHGWDFIGGAKGDVNDDTYELTRQYLLNKKRFENNIQLQKSDKEGFKVYKQLKAKYEQDLKNNQKKQEAYKKIVDVLNLIQQQAKHDSVTIADLENFQPADKKAISIKKQLLKALKNKVTFKECRKDVDDAYEHFDKAVKYNLNIDFEPRNLVGDDYNNLTEWQYGNNEVEGPKGDHGTHVSGIIGAVRDNKMGAEGVANNVKIMALRVVPNGDERDKDIANAIRYAAQNGAKIINMSFGKQYSPHKHLVDSAVKFALSKDVLFVHAAGNDGVNLDDKKNLFFPCANYQNSTETAKNHWIEVGAIGPNGYPASFSNYGKNTVDLFAPGVHVYSTYPNFSYEHNDGTSMAAPVVAGVAALVRSYYPALSAAEVKEILLSSSFQWDQKLPIPGKKRGKKKLSDLCIAGGVVNTYNAFLFLDKLKK